MRPICVSVALAAALFTVTVTSVRAQTAVFIEYTVTGSASASGREVDVVMCSSSEDGLNIHSMGEWVFTFDAPSAEAGEHEARVRVAAPTAVTALHDDDFRTDDRLTGDGTIIVESAGKGEMGIPLLRVRYTAEGLSSDTGATIDVEGTLVCPLL
ncbi:MAG: hypothetical protein PVJ64_02110 [Gemmatimonadales bacterium]|jgi:hypothetical protein